MATAFDGEFLLRIEDIDQSRARPEWEAQIYDDLAWLGLRWPTPVMRQSDRLDAYLIALEQLWSRGLIYTCQCSRRDIAQAMSAPQEGAALPHGPDGLIYPGTCRHTGNAKPSLMPTEAVLRLDMRKALDTIERAQAMSFSETGRGPDGQTDQIILDQKHLIENVGDIVLARRDMGTSYHLSVVLDDATQRITHVVRGQDLFEATAIHVVLQRLLNLPTPIYHHHTLIRDDAGRRLAKRDDARAISLYRNEGASPQDIRALVGLD